MDKLTPQQEIRLLRSAVIGLIGRDREGKYRPKFVREMLEGLKRTPTRQFTDKHSFLKELGSE